MKRKNPYPEQLIFGQNLQFLTQKENINDGELARRLKYDKNAISAIFLGNKNLTITTIDKIAKYFEVPVYSMFLRNFRDDFNTFKAIGYSNKTWEILQNNLKIFIGKDGIISATKINFDSGYISRLCSGKYKNVRVETILRLSKEIKIAFPDLLQEN